MSTYDRKGLAHSRKVLTSSLGATRQPLLRSVETPLRSFIQETRRRFNENLTTSRASSVLTIRERNFDHLSRANENLRGIIDVEEIPLIFAGISKPSAAVDRLVVKRKTDHEEAVEYMAKESTAIQAACENEFENLSTVVQIEINGIRRGIDRIRDESRRAKMSDSNFRADFNVAWIEASALIDVEKRCVDRFYNDLLAIEKKRKEDVKPLLKKYYKIFHNVSHLLPYEIQVYLENQILRYNEIILANHRVYADLQLQMHLLADFERMKFKRWIEDST